MISQLLMKLGVEEKTAREEACRIEHDISQDTFDKIKNWLLQNHLIDQQSIQ